MEAPMHRRSGYTTVTGTPGQTKWLRRELRIFTGSEHATVLEHESDQETRDKHETRQARTEDLRGVTATTNLDADVNLLELVVADEEHRLENLVPHGLRQEAINGVSVHVEDTLPPLAVRDRDGILLQNTNTEHGSPYERGCARSNNALRASTNSSDELVYQKPQTTGGHACPTASRSTI